MTLQDIIDLYPERLFMKADGFDDAVIGFDPNTDRLVYDRYEMVQILIRDGMSEEEAIEYLAYNTWGTYFGEQTPIYIEM